jgi:hypothetical protein
MFSMLLFVISFLAIYAAMHALVFWGVYPLLTGHPLLPTLTAGWMALMIVAPVAVRLLDRNGYQLPARALAWIGYSWMGFLFLAFALFLIFGLWHLFVLALSKLLPAATLLTIHRPAASALVLLAVLAAALQPEAADLRVETVQLISSAAGRRQLRIADSDLHLGLIHRGSPRPDRRQDRATEPDLLVATGTSSMPNQPPRGVGATSEPSIAAFGQVCSDRNHEFYAGLDQSLDYLQSSGFTVLRNTAAAPADFLRIVGVDDPAGGAPDELPLLEQADQEKFVLLLKHRPRIGPQSEGLFDLQLSGHAHGGQIFPFRLLTRLFYPLYDGLYRLAGGSVLYTSRGTGTWGPPMRILSPPEITLFEIVRQP